MYEKECKREFPTLIESPFFPSIALFISRASFKSLGKFYHKTGCDFLILELEGYFFRKCLFLFKLCIKISKHNIRRMRENSSGFPQHFICFVEEMKDYKPKLKTGTI